MQTKYHSQYTLTVTSVISTSKLVLVPYLRHHVPKYHEWMQDPDIQIATASDPLTLEEEYEMQESWRQDADKLTFIACTSFPTLSSVSELERQEVDAMVGDVNLFLSTCDDEEEESSDRADFQDADRKSLAAAPIEVVGEIELMVAKTNHQRQGYGRAILLVFLSYILRHQTEILQEYCSSQNFRSTHTSIHLPSCRFKYLRVRINESNSRSLALFESIGFTRISEQANYFGELELRRDIKSLDASFSASIGRTPEHDMDDASEVNVIDLLTHYGIQNYSENTRGQ